MKRLTLLTVSLATLLISSCCFTCRFFKDPEIDKQQFIRDEFGRICIYHGVNISNFSKHSGDTTGNYLSRGKPDTCWQQPDDFYKMKTWGFNLSRMIWQWEAIEPQKDQLNKAYIQRQLKRIEWANLYDVQVIVDIHQDLYAQKFCGNGFPEWTIRDEGQVFEGCKEPWNLAYLDPAVIASYDNFWNNDTLQDKYVAMIDSVFRWVDTISNVIGVDVMNEPIPDLSGKFERVKLTRLYTRIQDLVKAKGYRKLIVYEPWMSTSTGIPSCLKFEASAGTVYSPHYYDMFVDAQKPYGSANYEVMKKAIAVKVREAQEFKSPILYGEFGATPNYLDYLKDLLNEFDRYSVGWTYYSYDLPQHSAFAFIDENKNPRQTLSVLVRVYPMKIAGNKPVYNTSSNQFLLSYEKIETNQPTVIFIPEGLTITVETAGKYERSGQYLLYTNTAEIKQSIKVTF
jgi:endoglycosylceramidase